MFKFSLEPVLSLREKIEDNKKRELGEATQHREKVYKEKLYLEQIKEEALNLTRRQSRETVNVLELRTLNQYNSYMVKAVQNKEDELDKAKQLVDEKREALLEAVKDRKILDNLKTIHKENFEEEEKRAEQRILDDMVTYRFGNKGKG